MKIQNPGIKPRIKTGNAKGGYARDICEEWKEGQFDCRMAKEVETDNRGAEVTGVTSWRAALSNMGAIHSH